MISHVTIRAVYLKARISGTSERQWTMIPKLLQFALTSCPTRIHNPVLCHQGVVLLSQDYALIFSREVSPRLVPRSGAAYHVRLVRLWLAPRLRERCHVVIGGP